MSVVNIRDSLLVKLNSMTSLKAAYAYPTGNPSGNYPFAVLTMAEGEGSFASNVHNLRKQGFWVRVYQEQSKMGQGVQAAENISITVMDELQTALDRDTTLSGVCKYVIPVSWDTAYIDRELDTRILEVKIEAHEIINTGL
ncbi:MAG: hypothetical protein WC549_00615 [Actinomycetota bacterium]